MALCEICLRLDFATISQTGVKKFLRLDEGPNLRYYVARGIDLHTFRNSFIQYHDTLDSLYASAKSCDICRLVQISVETVFRTNPGLGSGYEFWIGGREGSDGFEVVGFDESRTTGNPGCELMAAFGFCVESGSQLANVIHGRVVPPSPRSSLVLDQIKGWVQRCTEHHKHAKHESDLLPTRVLKIINHGEEVILHDFNDTNGHYAALSHCWGSTQTITLTNDNIEKLRNGIKVCNLPQTFQDAIWLSDQIGIPYLWIDSLCIIQDDPADWGRESARMCDVYGGSHLTIAACRACNSQDGFLGRRLAPSYIPVPFHRNGVSGEVLAFPVPLKYVGDPIRVADLEDEPLTSRGWALQERCLSPRTLNFCLSKVCFECDDGFVVEDKSSLAPSLLYPPDFWSRYSTKFTNEQRRDNWRRIVVSYSQRKLTMDDDKLPAIGGLAARFSLDYIPRGSVSVPGNRYLAGLWFDDVIRGLCWSIHAYRRHGVRPQKYRAPTWSWASVDGQVDYKSAWVHSLNELAVVQDAHVELESPENIFGKVADGWVCLKALKLRPYRIPTNKSLWVCEDGTVFRIVVTWDSEPYQAPEKGESADLAMGTSDLFLIPLGWVDGHLQAKDPGSLFGPLFIIVKTATHRIQSYAHVPGFQRVGFGTGVWLNDGNEGTDRAGLKRLIIERYVFAKERGDLESIILV